MRAMVLALAATACTQVTHDFVCSTDADCLSASGAAGQCEGNHRCSLADASCAGGFRFGDLAGDVSNQCTSDVCATIVRAGVDDTCIVRGNGSVACWGGGDGSLAPVDVPAGTITQLDNAAAGLCVRYADNRLYCARGATTGAIDLLAPTAVAGGRAHTCALSGGKVSCWGQNDLGQLGDGTETSHAAPAAVSNLSQIKQLASGGNTSCVIDNSDEVWCWGDDHRGEVGRGPTFSETTNVPLQAGAPGSLSVLPAIAQVAMGDEFVCSVASNGDLWCWGGNDSYQCAQSNTPLFDPELDSPGRVTAAPANLVQVTAGSTHACARAMDGKVYCWGANRSHQVASAGPDPIMTPSLVVDDAGAPIIFRDISAGAQHTCGTTTSNAVMCWGDNAKAQIGHGAPSTVTTPMIVGLACR